MYQVRSRSPSHRNRAVSPVIGVVLMVAITIVLAAAIGAFVFGLTPSGDTAPIASVTISGQVGSEEVRLSHHGGDPLDLDDYTLLINGSDADGNDSIPGRLYPGEHQDVAIERSGDVEATLRHDPSGELIARSVVRVE